MWRLGIALLLLAAAPVQASVYKDFAKVWDARDKTYRAEREALDASAKSSAERAIESLVAGDPGGGDDLVMALNAAWSLSELVGRGQTLYLLREHIATKPSAALSEVWMQGKVDEVRRRQADADMIERQMDTLKDRGRVSIGQWIAALERLSMMRGTIYGTTAELALINQNLQSYYRARSEEGTASAAIWATVLTALGSALQQSQHDIRDRSAACARTGNCRRQ